MKAGLCLLKSGYLKEEYAFCIGSHLALKAPVQLTITKPGKINSPRAKLTLSKTQSNLTVYS